MNKNLFVFSVLALAAVPLRAEKPWAVPRSMPPTDEVCLSRPVAACMDNVIRHLEATPRISRVFIVHKVVAHDPVEQRYDFADAERALLARANHMRPIAQLGESIPIRTELTGEIISIYRAAEAHLAIKRAPEGPRKLAAMRHVAVQGGSLRSFFAAEQMLD